MPTANRQIPAHLQKLVQELVERVLRLPRRKLDRVAELQQLFVAAADDEERQEIVNAVMEIVQSSATDMKWPRGPDELLDDTVSSEAARRVESYRRKVGQNIKRARKAKKWTQDELATAAGIPQPHVCRLEQGRHAATDTTIERIAAALGVPAGQLDPALD